MHQNKCCTHKLKCLPGSGMSTLTPVQSGQVSRVALAEPWHSACSHLQQALEYADNMPASVALLTGML